MEQVDDLATRPGEACVEVRDVADVSWLPVEPDAPAPDDPGRRPPAHRRSGRQRPRSAWPRGLDPGPGHFGALHRDSARTDRSGASPTSGDARVRRPAPAAGRRARGTLPGHQRATDARASLAPSLSISRGATVQSEAASEEAAPESRTGQAPDLPPPGRLFAQSKKVPRASATGGRREARTSDPGEATVEALDRRVLGDRRLARELASRHAADTQPSPRPRTRARPAVAQST